MCDTYMTRDGISIEGDCRELSPDAARAIASELNDYADQFEANEYQFPSNLGGRR